jgi:two-component system chemotaxis sensor kinase CheA
MLGKREALDSTLLLDVICAPGFTTRDVADLTSGRGVGMAAVQSAVSELGGVMTLNTEPGKGTRFTIQLPLTLAITDSLLVSVERHKFAVPQASVQEVFAVDSSTVTMFENNEVIPYRNGVLPIMRLSQLFAIKSRARKRMHILVIGAGPSAIGLGVDRILGQREIVVRGITDPMLKIPGVSGATEIGDGQPVLIIDVHALMRTQRGRAVTEHQS